ncbi:hypothetical protein [Paracoccus benzoatiresistens]|uniref:Uncharacterized protein n=1 Tax=Paracoccus benzoatiresistens TaxID=2997341 RepID=A0ABT4JB07_9RHOB|nr:hypothetical protein [Paracoccus sp. EF6]MCZ0963890.1 hypothetical protein [Paracoccus sp. EF6]
MDFTAFNSRAAAETGAPMTILHPVTGEHIMHGEEACKVIVRGTESPTAQAALAALRKARMADKQPEAAEGDKSMTDLHAELVAAAVPLIMGFEHVSLGDRALTAADAREFLDLNMVMLDLDGDGKPKSLSFAEQVLRFAGQRANFLPKQPRG